jgi:hypothetical protein
MPPAGITLRSMGLATPGVDLVAVLSGPGSVSANTNCSSFTNLSQSAAATFDGCGILGGAQLTDAFALCLGCIFEHPSRSLR